MKLNNYVTTINWEEVLDIVEQYYPEFKEVIPEFYFLLDSLSENEDVDTIGLTKIFVDGYYDEDYDIEKVDVTVKLDGETKTDFINAEVDVVITNKSVIQMQKY